MLVDAGFFLKRATRIYGHQTPEATARQLHRMALDHLNDERGRRVARLYRIFVYDAAPADFVPAAKLARREGIDFVLDPMWSTIRPDLHEHIDGLKSVCPRPGK